jgi:hypothetical protein
MNRDDEKDRPFPDGYKHVEQRLTETTERLEQIDEHIQNLPKDQGQRVQFKPPTFIGSRQPGSRDRAILGLETHKNELKADELAKAEADTRGADSPTRREVLDRVRESLYPNPFRTLSQEERDLTKSSFPEIEESQEYMDALIVDQKNKQKEASKAEKATSEKQENVPLSERFSQGLRYTIAVNNSGRSNPSKSQDRDKDLDRD